MHLTPPSQPEPEPVVVTVIDVVVLEVNMGDPMYFEFEKLDVYKVTLDFLASADDVAAALPKSPTLPTGASANVPRRCLASRFAKVDKPVHLVKANRRAWHPRRGVR